MVWIRTVPQDTAYFTYANRTVLGLGLSPNQSENQDDGSHG